MTARTARMRKKKRRRLRVGCILGQSMDSGIAHPFSLMVKKVVRRDEVKVSGVLLIEAADNPRPVHKLCHQTQHPKQDHHLESPRARPESLPGLSFDSSQQVVQKQEEKQGWKGFWPCSGRLEEIGRAHV